MTGGLLQMVASGRQDVYLTINPEITFFKKVFRRYTNFATELNRIAPEQSTDYDNVITFILNNGDCINRCYLEINLPQLSFSDRYITNSGYIQYKNTQINNYNTLITKWTGYYNNLKGYVDIETQLYRTLRYLLLSDNITINSLKDNVNRFNLVNKTNLDMYKNKIDPVVYNNINMSLYINSITLQITTTVPNPNPSIYIMASTISTQLDKMYDMMVKNLTYYNNKINYNNVQLNKYKSTNNINFNYAPYLGHNYFDYFSLQIGGIELSRYSNEILHINQMHTIKNDYMSNYLKMIGMVPELTTFNSSTKGPYKVLVPLIYWFNKDTGSSLPLVALQYSTVSITVKINPLNKIISFQDYELSYYDATNFSTDSSISGYILNTNLLYTSYSYDIINKMINYTCGLINYNSLEIVFPDLTSQEITIILQNNGTLLTLNQITKILHPELSETEIGNMNGGPGLVAQYVINKSQWLSFMLNITDASYNTLAPKVASYYPYINYNLYYSMIPKPDVNLICETVYLDDVERQKFADSKLEYIVEVFDEDIYNVSLNGSFNCELEFVNPSKEILWYIQPQIFTDGLTQYGQNLSLVFDTSQYFSENMFNDQKLLFSNFNLLLDNIDNNYYTYMLSYKYLNNVLPKGIYYNSFCLYPEETQPSGTVNFTEIKGKHYIVNFNNNFIKDYKAFLKQLYGNNTNLINGKSQFTLRFVSKYYDLFVINKGSAKLLFTL